MFLLEEDNNVLKGHSSVVLCMIKIDKQRVGTGSLDKTIWIWRDFKMVKALEGHKDQINMLALVDTN
jgi:WD40 repeat protein